MACSRAFCVVWSPHISTLACKLLHTLGRVGWPNILQLKSVANCTQGTPAGFPFGMPGMALLMLGAMQQAAQLGLQFICFYHYLIGFLKHHQNTCSASQYPCGMQRHYFFSMLLNCIHLTYLPTKTQRTHASLHVLHGKFYLGRFTFCAQFHLAIRL